MADDIVSMKLDVVFKKMFVDNRDMLQAFVASMLEIPVDSISGLVVKNPEIPPDFAGGKFSRLDLNMTVRFITGQGCTPRSLKAARYTAVFTGRSP